MMDCGDFWVLFVDCCGFGFPGCRVLRVVT